MLSYSVCIIASLDIRTSTAELTAGRFTIALILGRSMSAVVRASQMRGHNSLLLTFAGWHDGVVDVQFFLFGERGASRYASTLVAIEGRKAQRLGGAPAQIRLAGRRLLVVLPARHDAARFGWRIVTTGGEPGKPIFDRVPAAWRVRVFPCRGFVSVRRFF